MSHLEELELTLEWRDVKGYEGLYKVSEYGDVISLKSGEKKLLNQYTNNKYFFVVLYKDKKRKTCLIHRLVATAFCEGFDDSLVVNHMDENTANNHYTNLEWCTQEYNINYGTRNEKVSKKVRCVELDIIFDSVLEAAEYVNGKQSGISRCLAGRRKTHRDYHWEYVS